MMLEEKRFNIIKELLRVAYLGWDDLLDFIVSARKVHLMDPQDFIYFKNLVSEYRNLKGDI